ncbi:hypothetical protein [Paenibacillus mendelii]|uniref:Uncharacterized protein n=1 Tax=Paenibacillus mendelii TaxID=206163 RepID=A0ABV6JIQ1_9BACL|nr:hypothetical protein [Paenibacillus mendelii]MCQ6558703.1 hypothetical protein [Paenibacillus mendelii]
MLCPICNGLEQLSAACPVCSSPADDCGLLVDYTAPYAPYQPYDEASSNFMETMIFDQKCQHVVYCQRCDVVYEVTIQKWREGGT